MSVTFSWLGAFRTAFVALLVILGAQGLGLACCALEGCRQVDNHTQLGK